MQVYYPYFRGKQFELMAIRELAPVMASSGFVPIIEPVREPLTGLNRALTAIADAGGRAIVVVNPLYGDHRENGDGIVALLQQQYEANDAVRAAFLLRSDTNPAAALARISDAESGLGAVIHAGFTDARAIAEAVRESERDVCQIFVQEQANMLYRKHFVGYPRVLIHDGFERRRNADYAEVDNFSDLHATFRDLGMNGYGDFLTVGDSYSEGGGPAYAVAIHLTYIDPAHDDAMFVQHFVSDTNDTPTDPAGKFKQALDKLIRSLDGGDSRLIESTAVQEFRAFHARGHFPGLGYVKKLSMKHHVETLADFHQREGDV